MEFDFFDSAEEFVLVFLIPLSGYVLNKYLNNLKLVWVFICSGLLIGFFMFGYLSPIPLFFQILYLTSVGSLIALIFSLIQNEKVKNWVTSLSTILLIVPSAFLYFIGVFGGGHESKRICQSYYYQVDEVYYTAFSGRPVTNFELREYTIFPIFYRYVDKVSKVDKKCVYQFEKESFEFDYCKKTLNRF